MPAHKYLQDTNGGEAASESERVWCGHQEQELQFLTFIQKGNKLTSNINCTLLSSWTETMVHSSTAGFILNHSQQFNLSWSSTCVQWWNSCLDPCIYTSPGVGLNSPTKSLYSIILNKSEKNNMSSLPTPLYTRIDQYIDSSSEHNIAWLQWPMSLCFKMLVWLEWKKWPELRAPSRSERQYCNVCWWRPGKLKPNITHTHLLSAIRLISLHFVNMSVLSGGFFVFFQVWLY